MDIIQIINILTLVFAGFSIPYIFRYMFLAGVSIKRNKLTSEQKKGFAVMLSIFGLLGLVTSFNIVIRFVDTLGFAGGYNLSVLRSFFTQLAVLLVAVVFGGVGNKPKPNKKSKRPQS